MAQKPNQRGATRESIRATKIIGQHVLLSPGKYFRQHQSTLMGSFMRLVGLPVGPVL